MNHSVLGAGIQQIKLLTTVLVLDYSCIVAIFNRLSWLQQGVKLTLNYKPVSHVKKFYKPKVLNVNIKAFPAL